MIKKLDKQGFKCQQRKNSGTVGFFASRNKNLYTKDIRDNYLGYHIKQFNFWDENNIQEHCVFGMAALQAAFLCNGLLRYLVQST